MQQILLMLMSSTASTSLQHVNDFWVGSLLWLMIMALNIFLAIFIKSRHLLVLNVLVFVFMSLSALTQYLGTEVYKNLTIAELGPSRFTQFNIFINNRINYDINKFLV